MQEHGWTWKLLLSDMCQTKTNPIGYHLYLESKKNDTNELIYKTETFTYLGNKHYYQRGREEGRDNLGFGIDVYTLLIDVYTLLYLK